MKFGQRMRDRKTLKIAAVLTGLLVIGVITHGYLSEQRAGEHGGFRQGNARAVSYPGHKGRGGHQKPWPIIATDWAVSIGKMLAA